MATAPAAASCINGENGCVMFDCLVHLWEWLDPPVSQAEYEMENNKTAPATQQPLTQQHLMAHHVHPDQIYSKQITPNSNLMSPQQNQIQPNGVMHQLLQSQYLSNIDSRSPLLENRHEVYGTGQNQDYARQYGANDNYNYPQSPPRIERTDLHTDHNVNHELLQNIPKGYNVEVYQDYLKRNPPMDTNQIYQNHQPMYRTNVNQYGSKPYLPYSNRIGPQSNTELLRRQYNEIQQMKLQQQIHYQNQAQMQQQQKFAERQLLLQQIHGVQPPPNLQNSIYSDGSYRDLDRYSSKNDFKQYSSSNIQKDTDVYAKSNDFKELEKQQRNFEEAQWHTNLASDFREIERHRKQLESEKVKIQYQSPDQNNQNQRSNVGVISPMKSSDSSSPSVRSPSSEGRKSSSGQALRSPIAQRIPSAPVAMAGILYKQGSDGLKVWRKRWFVLSEYCLFYYKNQDEEKLLGSVLLPSYKVSACTSEDKVLRKYAFKLEHANMRTYILAAPDQEAMIKWVRVLTMAALMQTSNDRTQKQTERAAAKVESDDETPGPTYANAPPKPRRSNDGYNSPSPEMYDPNYDLLKKPESHYSQGTRHIRYQEHMTQPNSPNQENTYIRSPQSLLLDQSLYQTKRSYDSHNFSLSLSNTTNDRLVNNQPSTSTSGTHKSNAQSPYVDNRSRIQQQKINNSENRNEQLYDRHQQRNPFLTNIAQIPKDPDNQSKIYGTTLGQDKANMEEIYPEMQLNIKTPVDINAHNKDVYGEFNTKYNRSGNVINERLLAERRTPDAYGRSTTMSVYGKGKNGDYEDVYAINNNDNTYGQTYTKLPHSTEQRDTVSITSQKQVQEYTTNHTRDSEKTFSGPSVLRRKKMQSSGIQPAMPRPHSADFLEYESKNEMHAKTLATRAAYDQPKQPQRPKSSLDINSYYDPSSDRYYSEESYAAKMRQSAQYLQQGLSPRNIQIPLDKYASGLVEKQLHSPYAQSTNNNYETEFSNNRSNRDNISYNSKQSKLEGMHSNWTLKEKEMENKKEHMNRSGSVLSDGSSASNFVKDMSTFDPNSDAFMRSASARLPSVSGEKDGEKKVQQREESMKRLLEWKQRMLQSPLTRKSTPATISLARSLTQSRQSLRSDQYKSKTYTNNSYNSYSSDDEEETSGTDLQKASDMQAGRSQRQNTMTPIIAHHLTPHAPSTNKENKEKKTIEKNSVNFYENVSDTLCPDTITAKDKCEDDNIYEETTVNGNDNDVIKENIANENDENGYETHESEAESETNIEYTDNDLDEVLLDSDAEQGIGCKDICISNVTEKNVDPNTLREEMTVIKPETPPVQVLGEDHYLPMSPRKTSTIESAHKILLENLSVFDDSLPRNCEDNPYVEMNLCAEEDDTQTYEIVCVSNTKTEPVYMELFNLSVNDKSNDHQGELRSLLDVASNFADTKDLTLKRSSKAKTSKGESGFRKETLLLNAAEDKVNCTDTTLNSPFSRFSISDTFRPASYYLRCNRNENRVRQNSDIELTNLPFSDLSFTDELSEDAFSKYVLDKLDKSDISQDNSIIKMLTSESQKMNSVKRKTTSLMIYGSKTSIHDTLSRGEKARNSRASLSNDRHKFHVNSENNYILENSNASSIKTDLPRNIFTERELSRLSLESDPSSKLEFSPVKISPEVSSLNESESSIEIRRVSGLTDLEILAKRRPLSDESIFELFAPSKPYCTDLNTSIDLDSYLNNLQPEASHIDDQQENATFNISMRRDSTNKDNLEQANLRKSYVHMRSSSTPVCYSSNIKCVDNKLAAQCETIDSQISNGIGSQSSCSSTDISKSPISYYCKDYDEENLLIKNLNTDTLSNKIKQFDIDKVTLKCSVEPCPNTSFSTTGIHSRESSTEHSAPYYYSDLSSQEHINVLPISHFLKNTNLHRKLNNQRRRGPLVKKNEISHIHNPIHNHQTTDHSFEIASQTRSISVEFLTATDKDPDIDMKNLYESSGGKRDKIPESMSLMSSLVCKNSTRNNFHNDTASPETDVTRRNLNSSSLTKVSTASMSSHCSENSSNTVYYDAETETNAYENIIYEGENQWDEDSLWRDNLRRVSHRHARSMDDLDITPTKNSKYGRIKLGSHGLNSIQRVKKVPLKKICRNVTYVNCEIQGFIKQRERNTSSQRLLNVGVSDVNDEYVSLAKNVEMLLEQSDDGIYEQLMMGTSDNSIQYDGMPSNTRDEVKYCDEKRKKKFEIDREKLRQWDLMSSGLIKGGQGCVRGLGAGVGVSEALCSTDSGADSASNEASVTISNTNIETGINTSNQQELAKKAFLGSNSSIGRNNRETNIPVRAVSPRVRWVEDKSTNDHYGSQQISNSQQNLNTLNMTEDFWMTARSPSRASQQPIRAVSPRIRRNTDNNELQTEIQPSGQEEQLGEVPSAGELLGRTHEELVLLLIQLRRRHAATHRAIKQCCAQMSSIEDNISSLKAAEREESLQRLEQLKMQLMDLECQYEKSKPLVQLVDNMVKLGSLYNRPGSTVERLERNQRLRQKVLAEHALEQQRWIESAAAGKPLETEAARARVSELWALEQELADEAAILQGLKTDKDTIESLLTGVRGKLDSVPRGDLTGGVNVSGSVPSVAGAGELEAELARVHAMLALNSKKLEQTVADNARLERELQHLRRALQARRAAASPAPHPAPTHTTHATAMLEDEVTRVQQLVSALQRQRQELSRAVRHLTQQSQALQTSHGSHHSKRRPISSWQETNLDTGHTIDHGQSDYDYETVRTVLPPGHYESSNVEIPLYVDTRAGGADITSPLTSEEMQTSAFGNLSNVEKQEIKTVRIVKRESERRQRDRERSLQPMSDWPTNNITTTLDQFLEEELIQPTSYTRASSVPRTDYGKFEEYYSKPQTTEPPNYLRLNQNMSSMEQSPKYPSSPSLSNYDYSRDISSLSSSYHKTYDRSSYDQTMSLSTQYFNSPTNSSRTLTNDPLSKTSSIASLSRSHMELSPIFKSEAAKQIITEMSSDGPKNGSLHRRQVPKEKRRHYTAPHHLSAKTLNELPKDSYNQDKLCRSLDDADMERVLRAPPDIVRSAIAPQRFADSTIDQLLAAPQKILIPERYIPEKPPELSPEEQQKRQEKVESIKKMLTGTSAADPNKSPDKEEKKQREHLLQMNQILAKQVTEMSKIIAVKALEELPLQMMTDDQDDRSPDVELPIYQQRDNFFT